MKARYLFCFVLVTFLFAQLTNAQQVSPILVTGMVHIDPLPVDVGQAVVLFGYNNHRDGLQWYIDYANQTGVKLSAQMTGVYAEACVRQGHSADFASFMPGQAHHLGIHLHANVKLPADYCWHLIDNAFYTNADSAAQVFSDNIPWVNRIFEDNGFTSADNWLLHGTHAIYDGIDDDILTYANPNTLPYDNVIQMVGGTRLDFWIHLGGFRTEPWVNPADERYIRVPEVGGIIGYDQLHGPEGMVYGTINYQKRDFMRVYIEWRESVMRNEPRALWHFTWMIHPYQLITNVTGTDGRAPKTHIIELVEWLNANFINQTDETGSVIAEYANAEEIRDAYNDWRANNPLHHQNLQANLAAGNKPIYFPRIFDRLADTYYDEKIATVNANIVIHKFIDHNFGIPLYLVWSIAGNQPLEPDLTGDFNVFFGTNTTNNVNSSTIIVSEQPILLEPAQAVSVEDFATPNDFVLMQNYPNPFNPGTVIGYRLMVDNHVTLKVYDVIGNEITTLVDEEKSAGFFEINFNAADLSSGVYFYRIEAGSYSQTKAMLLLK